MYSVWHTYLGIFAPTKDKQTPPYLQYQLTESTTQISTSDPSTFRYRETCPSLSSYAHLQPIHVPKSHPVHSPRPFQSIAQCPQPPSNSFSSKEKSPIRLHHRLQPMLLPVILIRNTRDVDPQLIIITTIPAALAIFPEPPVTSLADLYLTAVIRTALCAVVVHAAVAAQSVVVC